MRLDALLLVHWPRKEEPRLIHRTLRHVVRNPVTQLKEAKAMALL
jgi:hypothetical protein